jgi:ABC-2 type transport system ATP-binding protein
MIEVRDLAKTYEVSVRGSGLSGAIKGLIKRERRTVKALDGVCFSVPSGELVGYIGPNGAGKSTTIKILSGILRPSSGEATVNGRIPWKDRIEHVRRIGAVFGQRTQLWWDLPVRESLALVESLYSLKAADARASFEELDGALDLGPLLDVPVRQLSLGQRMRCELAAALLPRPDTLFLDEPTIGLDAQAKLAVRDFVAKVNRERGVTVILTTHDMDDIEALATRVLLLSEGRTLFDGAMDELKELARERRQIVADYSCAVERDGLERAAKDVLSSRGATGSLSVSGMERSRVVWSFDPRELKSADAIAAIGSSPFVEDLTVEAEPVERIVARVYGRFSATQTPGGVR